MVSVSASIPRRTVLLSAPKILLFDLYRAIAPLGLSPQYHVRLIESVNREFVLTLSLLVVLIILAIVLALRDSRLWVAYAWIILPLLPTLNLSWMNQGDFVHDRYTYMSMMGVALLAAFAFAWIRKKWPRFRLLAPLSAALALALALASLIQSQLWANDVVLFSRAVSRAPESEWAQLNFGSALSARGRFAEAATHFVRSYELKPGGRAAGFAAVTYQRSGDLAQSEQWYNVALKFDPDSATAWFGLGQIRLAQHLPEQAIPCLKKALQFDPKGDGYHYEMGAALEAAGQPQQAIKEYTLELQLHPDRSEARLALERLQAPGKK